MHILAWKDSKCLVQIKKKTPHQSQTVEPQQKTKHKILLVAGQYLRMYLFFITLTWGLTLSRLAIWSIILT